LLGGPSAFERLRSQVLLILPWVAVTPQNALSTEQRTDLTPAHR
jgi:hypothetical protein